MPLNILHLSDLHVGNSNESLTDLLETIEASIIQLDTIDQIVFTGDIFDARSLCIAKKLMKEQTTLQSNDIDNVYIEKAVEFFQELIKKINYIQKINLTVKDILFVPGNHEISQELVSSSKHNDIFPIFKNFLLKLYEQEIPNTYDQENCTIFKVFEEQKIIILGFNSAFCKHDSVGNCVMYGHVHLKHRTALGQALLPYKHKEYNIVVIMHHHFYQIEEKDKDYIDKSNVNNAESFFTWLNTYNIVAILHGHKHENFIKRININCDPTAPDNVITAIAVGSVNKASINNAFNLVKVFQPHDMLTLKIFIYEKLRTDIFECKQKYHFPIDMPRNSIRNLSDLLNDTTKVEIWKIIRKQEIDSENYIALLNKIITNCSSCCYKLEHEKDIIFYMFIVAHCCANYNDVSIIETVKAYYNTSSSSISEDFTTLFFNLLKCKNVYDLRTFYINENISNNKNLKYEEKLIIRYSILSFYLSSFYYTLTNSTTEFFNKELIRKNDIIIPKDYRANSIMQSKSIEITSNEEKRAIEVKVICSNPLTHRIVSLIVNEFELILNSLEQDFSELGFNMYYIIGEIKNNSNVEQNLESYNFTAYMKALLDLLAGEGIYSNNKVFARELIQNSIDALNMRKNIDKTFNVETAFIDIKIEKRGDQTLFKIKDNGVGMTKYHVERYLTSIGRSFYKSVDFENFGISGNYTPISQFGIGFLSCFNVSKSIIVQTKYFDKKVEKKGKKLQIPSLDGCFFIEDLDIQEIGTEIFLVIEEDIANDLKEYIQKTFQNIEYRIKFNDDLIIDQFAYHKKLDEETKRNNLMFFIPLTDQGDLIKSASINSNYGIYFYKRDSFLHSPSKLTCLCNGILVDDSNIAPPIKHWTIYAA